MNASSTTARPKLFLSYGRSDGAELADRLRHDLAAAGYEVWQDTQIRAAHPWDDQIRNALLEADVAVAVLTPHAVRTADRSPDHLDSVCLDEINYVRFQRKRPIVPVMAVTCEPPLVLHRLEYVDMRGWNGSRDVYERAFARLVDAIAAALRGEIRNRSELADLSSWDFSAFLNEKRRDFCGRDWVFAELEQWRLGRRERALLIKGDAGAGKSAIVAELLHRDAGNRVIAYHCCQADLISTLQPGAFVRNLAAMIAARNEEYAAALAKPAVLEALRMENSARDPVGAFEIAVLTPLHQIAPPEESPRLIVIDALDEALAIQQAASPVTIVDVLAARMERIPDWLRIVATTRREPAVLDRMRGLRSWEIDAQDPRNLKDVSDYIAMRLRTSALQERLGGRTPAALHKILVTRSEGSFLYAQQVLDAIERDLQSADTIEKMPPGLYGLYAAFFARNFGDEAEFAALRPMLQVMVAAREPLDETQLRDASGVGAQTLFAGLRRLKPYFKPAAGRYAFFHKSLADWLTDPELRGTPYFIDTHRGHELLADLFWSEYRAGPAGMSRFAMQHLPSHLAAAARWEDLHALLCDLAFIEASCAASLVHELVADDLAAGNAFEQAGLHELRADVDAYARFVTGHAHLLQAAPETTFQLAANLPVDSVVTRRARERWESGQERRRWLDWINRKQAPTRCRMTLTGHAASVTAVAISPAGDVIASGCTDGGVKLWDVRTGAETLTLHGHTKTVTSCAFSPDGGRLVTASDDTTTRVWDAATGETLVTARHAAAVLACAFSADGATIISASSDGAYVVRDALSGAILREGTVPETAVSIALSKDGEWLAVGEHAEAEGSSVRVHRTKSGERVMTAPGGSAMITSATFSGDGSRLAIGMATDTRARLAFWDLATRKEGWEIRGYLVDAAAFSPDGQMLAGAHDGGLAVWTLPSTTEEIQRSRRQYVSPPKMDLPDHVDTVTCCAFLPDGQSVVSGSRDTTLKIWDLREDIEITPPLEVQPGIPIRIVELHYANGNFLGLSSTHHIYRTYGYVSSWSRETGRRSAQPYGFGAAYMAGMDVAAALAPDGRHFACMVTNAFVILDAATLTPVASKQYESPLSIQYSGDGRLLGLLSKKHFIVWNAREPEELTSQECDWSAFAFAPDGQTIAVARENGLQILDRASFAELAATELGANADVIRYSPDGTWIVTLADDVVSLIRRADLTGRVIYRLPPQQYRERVFAGFSPDGQLLAIVARNGADIQLWSPGQERAVAIIATGGTRVHAWGFSPDGRWLAWSAGNTARIWDLDAHQLVGRFSARGDVSALAWADDSLALGLGDDLGIFYLLELRAFGGAPR